MMIVSMVVAMVFMFANRKNFVRTVTVNYFLNGETTKETHVYVKGSVPVNVPSPEKEGSVFVGWYRDPAHTRSYDVSLPINESLSLYAGFLPLSKTLTSSDGKLFLTGCTKDIAIKIESELSTDELMKGLVLRDELTREEKGFGLNPEGSGFKLTPNEEYKEGHTYTLEIPEGACLSGADGEIRSLGFGIIYGGETIIGYNGTVKEIPELNPSAEGSLHAYTKENVAPGTLVLTGGNEKRIYLVSEVIPTDGGNCLLLCAPGEDSISNAAFSAAFELSLFDGTLVHTDMPTINSPDSAQKLSLLFDELCNRGLPAGSGEERVLSESNGIRISISRVTNSALGRPADLIEAVCSFPTSINGHDASLELKLLYLVSTRLSTFFEKPGDGKTYTDISLYIDTASELSISLVSADGGVVPVDGKYADGVADSTEEIRKAMAKALSESITQSLGGVNTSLLAGELSVDICTSFKGRFNAALSGADITARQTSSECISIRGVDRDLVASRRVIASFGKLDGRLEGLEEASFGLDFDIALGLRKIQGYRTEMRASSLHAYNALGVFESKGGSVFGDAYISLFSEGYGMYGNRIEDGCLTREEAFGLGNEYILPKNQKFTSGEYKFEGLEFSIKHILTEPLSVILKNGEKAFSSPSLQDAAIHISGPLADYSEYDANTGRIKLLPHPEVTADTLYLDVYYSCATTLNGGEVLPIHRKIVLKLDESVILADRVNATFKLDGNVIANAVINKGSAPGYVESGLDYSLFAEKDYKLIWDKDPYIAISEDTEYNLVSERVMALCAFLSFGDGVWNAEYESIPVGGEGRKSDASASGWISVYPYAGILKSGVSKSACVPAEISDSIRPFGELPGAVSGESMLETLLKLDASTSAVFIADYSGKTYDVTYVSGSKTHEAAYERNELRAGVPSLINKYRPEAIYSYAFKGWVNINSSDNGGLYTAEFGPASFTVTVLNEDGSYSHEVSVTSGEIPEFLKTPPVKNGVPGVWVSDDFGRLANWLDFPEFSSVSKDMSVMPYFGAVYKVTVDANGGKPTEGALPKELLLLPGEFDFASILPAMQKASDVMNSYSFDGWRRLNITEDMVLSAPFTATPHVYTVIFDAKDGRIDGESRIEIKTTYMELDAVIEKGILNIPERESTETKSYKFIGWKKVKTNKAYTYLYNAEYEESERLYKITLVAPDGGLFPSGDSELILELPYLSELGGFSKTEYLARIPSTGAKIKVIDCFLDGEKEILLSSVLKVKKDLTLTVKYKEIDNRKLTVMLDAGEGCFSNGKGSMLFEGYIGDPVPSPSDPIAPTGEGFTSVFLGWSGDIPKVFAENVSLKANYKVEKKLFTVTFYGSEGEIHAVYKVPYGEKIPIPKAPELPGLEFLGWDGLPESGNVPASDLKIYAKLNKAVYTITFIVDGEKIAEEKLYYGDKIMQRVYPYKPGYEFSGWKYPAHVTMPDENLTVSGTFKKGTYEITYVVDGKIYKKAKATYGDTVALLSLPKGAKPWMSTDVTVSSSEFVMPSHPVKLVTVTTEERYTISYMIDGEIKRKDSYLFGESVKLPKVPDDAAFTGKWLFRYSDEYAKLDLEYEGDEEIGIIRRGDYAFTGYMPGASLIAVPELKITSIGSGKDINQNGVDDFADIVNTARDYVNSFPIYESNYYFPTGYPTDWYGVCTDVIWRAYFGIGISLKDLVDSDIAYNATLGEDNQYLDKPGPLIDFRRVRNLLIYYKSNSQVLTNDTLDPTEWQPGDIVVFSPSHIGICSDKRDSEGLPYIIHHTESRGAIESDELGKYNVGDYKIVGHFRIDHDRLK